MKRTAQQAAQHLLQLHQQASPGPYRSERYGDRHLVTNGVHVVYGAQPEPDSVASCADQADADYVYGAYTDGPEVARALLALQVLCYDMLQGEGPNHDSLAQMLEAQGVGV